jgi:integrase
MLVGLGLIKNEHGVWIVRRKVPRRLREAVARVLDNGKERQTWLQRSLCTKDKKEATRLAPEVLQAFSKTLAEAEAQLAERPLRTALAKAEIDRIADFHFASVLAGDDEATREASKDEDFVRSIADQLDAAGVNYSMAVPFDAKRPAYGLTNRQIFKRNAELVWLRLPFMREALSRGDISMISEAMAELLDRFGLNLDPTSTGYRQLGMAVLTAEVRALDALAQRYCGEPVDTPRIAHLEPTDERSACGDTLRAALAGWRKDREPSDGVLAEYERAVNLFIQLHGDLPVAQITRAHARKFRETLQDMPWPRPGKLSQMSLPELAEWGREHAEAPKLSRQSVNKQFGGVQTIAKWAHRNGIIPDDVSWSDPFAGLRLETEEPKREPFTASELRTLFVSPVFTAGDRPDGGQGDVAFWLPLLALFTGMRRSEIAMLTAADVQMDDATEDWVIVLSKDKSKGKRLKTEGSARTIPVHPELVRIGFARFVETSRAAGAHEWLFTAVSPQRPGGAKAWTKWFRRYLNGIGITDTRKVLHSLRHGFKDALRAAGTPEDLNDALTGHTLGTVGRRYGAKAIVQRFGMPRLVEAIAKVSYPKLDLSAVRWQPPHAVGE